MFEPSRNVIFCVVIRLSFVKFYEYPLTKEKNKVELANTRLSFEEVQRTEQELS